MKIVVDTHTHTISSGHAYSTVQENAKEAPVNGIKMLAVTDHGPAMPGAPHIFHVANIKTIPSVLYGVRILRGVEANIIDYQGNIDIPEEYLKRLDFVIASLHDVCIEPSTVEENTQAMINVLKNPYVDALAHPGNPTFRVNIEAVVKAAKDFNKLIELNDHSFYVRTGSDKNCKKFMSACKEMGVRVVCGSDAHISFDIGNFSKAKAVLEDVGMPEDLVLSTSVTKLEKYLKERRERIRNS